MSSSASTPSNKPPIAYEDAAAIVRLLSNLPATVALSINERRAWLMQNFCSVLTPLPCQWLWCHSKVDAHGIPAFYAFTLNGGLSERAMHALRTTAHSPEYHELAFDPIKHLYAAGNLTITRKDYIPDEKWFASPEVQSHYLAANLRDFILSSTHLGDGYLSIVAIYHGDPHFTFGQREKVLLQLVMSEIDWLHREGTHVPGAAIVPSLSPRERQVLLSLLAGHSVKQIASDLQLSTHTVNDYMKSLHRRFNVNSRGQLLSKFLAGTATPTITSGSP